MSSIFGSALANIKAAQVEKAAANAVEKEERNVRLSAAVAELVENTGMQGFGMNLLFQTGVLSERLIDKLK